MPAGGITNGARTPVLYLAPWVDYGGSDKGTIDWFRWLDRERFEPSLICTQPSANRRLSEIEPFAREIWALPDLMPAERFPQFIFDFIDSRGIEIVHVMNSRLAFELLPDLASLPRPPRVAVQLHVEEETRDGYVRLITTRYGNLVDSFSVTSEHLAAAVEAYDVPRHKIEVIYTGVDAEEEFRPDAVTPVEIGEEGIVEILFPGRLCAQKDPHLMLDVASALREVEDGFRIHVVGDGELEAEVRDAVQARELDRHVRFHPPTCEIPRWYAAADVLLMTSVFEGMPYVVYEAMAMALPIVAPALPGNVELLGPEGGGLVDPRDDVTAYVERLAALVRDGSVRRSAGERLRARAREHLSLRAMAEAHEQLYDRLLRDKPLPPIETSVEPPAPPPIRFRDRPVREKPLVSVIVPCFNHGRFLPACIDSIERQTYEAIETIVVDDGSTDSDTHVALDAIERDRRATILRLGRNVGPSAARNAAIDRAKGRYVLPVDADNLLLEDAVDQLVLQLRAAGEEIGFIYPNLQFFGNRDDYFEPPEYNLHLLLRGNYCDTSALFDRQIFDAGLRFDEDIRLGHEDWDFVLTLAEHGVRGERARGKTLLYRKQGFSRADTVDHAQTLFHDHVRERHPLLFGERPHLPPFVTSKARWSPEVTLLALEPQTAPPREWDRQSCMDFELLGFSAHDWPEVQRGPALRRLPEGAGTTLGERLALGVPAAKGRIVVATRGDATELLATPDFVSKIIYLFQTRDDFAAVAFARGSDGGHGWRPLHNEEAVGEPHAIAWRRRDVVTMDQPLVVWPNHELRSLIEAFVVHGISIDWRHMEDRAGSSTRSGPDVASLPGVLRFRTSRLRRRSFFDASIEIPPALPEIPDPVRRWQLTPTWMPPATTLLCRHRERGSERRVITNYWHSPPGYELEYALGGVRTMPVRGTARLFALGGDEARYRAVEVDGGEEQPADATLLGHLELALLPLLHPVILARHPETGEELLVGGEDDLLAPAMERIGTIGYAEPYPIEPRTAACGCGPAFGLKGLVRTVDHAHRRHAYGVGETPLVASPSELGALLEHPQLDTEPVWLTEDGLIVTEHYLPCGGGATMLRAAKWTLAPLRWSGSWGFDARARSSARRAYESAAMLLRRNGAAAQPSTPPCGYLLQRSGHGRVPLYAAVHPVTHDQLLTTHRREATDMGYEDPVQIGYLVARAPVTGRSGLQPATVPWASRFGKEAERA
jgi:glycosyltransferase involved in cell wall biosynthesis/GT2 family glycosyltransferase